MSNFVSVSSRRNMPKQSMFSGFFKPRQRAYSMRTFNLLEFAQKKYQNTIAQSPMLKEINDEEVFEESISFSEQRFHSEFVKDEKVRLQESLLQSVLFSLRRSQ